MTLQPFSLLVVLSLLFFADFSLGDTKDLAGELRELAIRLEADSEPKFCEISNASIPVIAASDKLAISLPRANYHLFHATRDGWHSAFVETYHCRLAVWLAEARGTPLTKGSPTPEGQFRYRIEAELKAGTDYLIGVAPADTHDLPLPYRIAVSGTKTATFPPDTSRPDVPLSLGETREFSMTNRLTAFLGSPARYFTLRLSDPSRRWIQLRVESKSMKPSVSLLETGTDEVIGEGWFHLGKRVSEHTGYVSKESVSVVVRAKETFAKDIISSNPTFTLIATAFPSNPKASFRERVKAWAADPLGTFAVGVIVSAILSYLFYRLSRIRRDISYQVLSDRVLLHSHRLKESTLRVLRKNVEITDHVGFCSLALRYNGRSDLRAENVTVPIELVLKNVSSILRINADLTPGWSGVLLPSDSNNRIAVGISHLERGDKAQIDVFYTQKNMEAVECECNGRLVDGKIRRTSNKLDDFRTWIAVVLGSVGAILLVIGYIDKLFDIVPFQLLEFISDFFAYAWIVAVFYFVLDPKLRRAIGRFFDRHISRRVRDEKMTIRHLVVESSSDLEPADLQSAPSVTAPPISIST